MSKKSVLSKLKEEGDSCEPNADGSCPEGYELSPDAKMCMKTSQMAPESDKSDSMESSVSEFEITHNDPQFVVDKELSIKIEANKLVKFDEGEALELVENSKGNLQIGSEANVIEIDSKDIAVKFFEYVVHKDDLKIEEKKVSVSEAIKSTLSTERIAKLIIEQFSEKGSLSNLRKNNSIVEIKVGRKIKTMRTVSQKAASVKRLESKDKKFVLHKAIDIV